MVVQQMQIPQDTPIVSCAFTEHRTAEEPFPEKQLKKAIKTLIKGGCLRFFCGMAQGFDLLAGELVLREKKHNKDVRLIACLPCDNQEKYYPASEKKRYVEILEKADEKICLAERYYTGCMNVRDRYMADHAEALIAFLRKEKGGTAFTVEYFQKKYPHKKLILL